MPTKNLNRRKSICLSRPLSMKQAAKRNAHLLSQNVEPTRANSTAREKIHWNKHHFGTG